MLEFRAPADPEIERLATDLAGIDPDGSRWAGVLRRTYDMLYNGQETGRYKWEQLFKTEKTHFGTLFEINAQREFGFYDGDTLDYSISGIEVDAKWSQRDGGWMLPPESFGHVVLVATGSDLTSTWSLGLVRVTEENRRTTSNRDSKTQLNPLGRAAIAWLWRDAPLSPNVLLQLPGSVVDHILEPRSGQEKILRLLRSAEGRVIHRSTIATVGRQLDPMKRLRGNGGARTLLAKEGFLVLTGNYHGALAARFGAPVPLPGEVVAIRVVPGAASDVPLAGGCWRRAAADEAVVVPAPLLVAPKEVT